jgi:hypothetical protein
MMALCLSRIFLQIGDFITEMYNKFCKKINSEYPQRTGFLANEVIEGHNIRNRCQIIKVQRGLN